MRIEPLNSSGLRVVGKLVDVSRHAPRSIATTFRPARVSSSAMVEPDHPSPTMTTSAFGLL
ncbi:hypothetical protein [Acetobacter senegalensis]|uniref:hypothetical protein n=1 Tax=Acetobacter senegalensis TaxID=446692 RepID=UPI00200DFDB5|nr:hypothetical protein [Acetobacter senegalensis]